jgi:putative colanic acid biosynthesis acetyltransferase WcaF
MEVLDARTSNPLEGGPSFSFKHRIARAAWSVIWTTMGSWTPTPFHSWRRLLARSFGAKIASTAKIYPGVRIWYPRNLEMHEHACLGPYVNCYCMDRIVLEKYALVSQGAHLCGGTHDIDDCNFQLIARPIRICALSWIATEAFVGAGVTVHEGAVLGARAVTMKDLKSWTVYSGNRAEEVRLRKRVDLNTHLRSQ